MANICAKKLRAHPNDRKNNLEQYELIDHLGVSIRPADHTAVVFLAEQARLITYDTYYLWVSPATTSVLVALDETLG